jgi:hypothetical protein
MKWFVFISSIWIFACNNPSEPTELKVENKKRDTSLPAISVADTTLSYPQIFEAAFDRQTKLVQGGLHFSFFNVDLGNINIESGKIIACDPIVMRDHTPFTESFPVGKFPVSLAIITTDNDVRVAFSRITFDPEPVSKWQFALLQGEKPISLTDTSIYCYGVDGGMGLFIDSIANRVFSKKDPSEYEKAFANTASLNSYKGYIYEFDGHNLAAFPSGYGDGCYPTYIGYDCLGKPCRLLTDFQLVEWWKLKEKKN